EIHNAAAGQTVGFNYVGEVNDRKMWDDGPGGGHGDLVANDNIFTIQFTPAEILSQNNAGSVFRPFIGFCKPSNGASALNVFAEVWTSALPLSVVTPITGGQRTDYVVNYVATAAQISS